MPAGNVSVIERAFQLAATRSTIDEIKRALRAEGYAQVDAHLTGPTIRRELTVLIRKGTSGGPTPTPSG